MDFNQQVPKFLGFCSNGRVVGPHFYPWWSSQPLQVVSLLKKRHLVFSPESSLETIGSFSKTEPCHFLVNSEAVYHLIAFFKSFKSKTDSPELVLFWAAHTWHQATQHEKPEVVHLITQRLVLCYLSQKECHPKKQLSFTKHRWLYRPLFEFLPGQRCCKSRTLLWTHLLKHQKKRMDRLIFSPILKDHIEPKQILQTFHGENDPFFHRRWMTCFLFLWWPRLQWSLFFLLSIYAWCVSPKKHVGHRNKWLYKMEKRTHWRIIWLWVFGHFLKPFLSNLGGKFNSWCFNKWWSYPNAPKHARRDGLQGRHSAFAVDLASHRFRIHDFLWLVGWWEYALQDSWICW